MQITRLFAQNFMSFKNLDLQLADRGLVLVEGENTDAGGSNGAGKSTIFEAIVWCLFGTTTRGIKSADVVRRDREHKSVGNCCVIVEIDLDGSRLLVARHREHKQYGNKMLLVADGQDITMGGDRETQQLMQEMLQIDLPSFISAVMYPQGAAGFPGLTDSEQKNILERVLSVSRFADAQKRANERLVPLVEKLESLQKQILARRTSIKENTSSLDKMRQSSAKWLSDKTQQLAAMRVEIETVKALNAPTINPATLARHHELFGAWTSMHAAEMGKCNGEVQQLDALLSTQNGIKRNSEGTRDTYRRLLAADQPQPVADPGLTVAEAEAVLAKMRADERTADRALTTCRANIAQVQDKITLTFANTTCVTCKQPLPETNRKQVIDDLNSKLQQHTEELQKLESALTEAINKSAEATARLQEATQFRDYKKAASVRAESEQQITVAETAIANATAESTRLLAEKETKIARMSELRAIYDELAKLDVEVNEYKQQKAIYDSRLQQLQDKLAAAEATADPYIEFVSRYENELQEVTKSLSFLTMLKSQIEEQCEYLRTWYDGFGNQGVKSLLFDTVTPFLSYQGNEYLQFLSNGTAGLLFQTQKTLVSGEKRDKFNVEVFYTNGSHNYAGLSGGERRRVDVAALFALGDLGSSRSMVPIYLRLLDEPFDNLDGPGAERVVELLKTKILPKAGTIIVVTHDDNLKSLIANRIVVRKKNGISSIV